MEATESGRSTGTEAGRGGMLERYLATRRATLALCEPLRREDYIVQPAADESPVKWHLAHTSWFFETLVLDQSQTGYTPFHEDFTHLFNSYYESVGARAARGLVSRPTVAEVLDYRAHVDEGMTQLLEQGALDGEMEFVTEVGTHHEQQHQELLLAACKQVLSQHPFRPPYVEAEGPPVSLQPTPPRWIDHAGGMVWIGHDGEAFSFDNERPQHQVYIEPFQLGSRLVTCGEYLEFIEDGGYEKPELWLYDGWETVRSQGWRAPMYWEARDGGWRVYTLGGLRELVPAEPVCHVSYYEADAFARWRGARLPTEIEWEVAARNADADQGTLAEQGSLHPLPDVPAPAGGPRQLFGDVWEWTMSPYTPYPRYKPFAGYLEEYNGKFMCNHMVLRGGSFATSRSHIRSTYRNFFRPDVRRQFAGIRLARHL